MYDSLPLHDPSMPLFAPTNKKNAPYCPSRAHCFNLRSTTLLIGHAVLLASSGLLPSRIACAYMASQH